MSHKDPKKSPEEPNEEELSEAMAELSENLQRLVDLFEYISDNVPKKPVVPVSPSKD